MSFLDIGIPTFNRSETVASNIREILADDFLDRNDVGLIVSDNCSEDDTSETLTRMKESSPNASNFRFLRNKENLGVFGNIFQLFELTDSDYLLITSDEDFVVKNQFPALIDFLRATRPSFVSPQVFLKNSLYRGSRNSKPIKLRDYHTATFYISGLVFDVDKTRRVIREYGFLMEDKNLLYKQSLIGAELLRMHRGSSWFFGSPVTEKRYSLPTQISRDRTYPYQSVPGRWESFVATERYFSKRIEIEDNIDERKVLARFLSQNRVALYEILVHAIKTELPEVIPDFRFGVYKKETRSATLAKVLSLARKILSEQNS